MTSPDLTIPMWRKSKRSGPEGGDCVEVAAGGRVVLARDSKDPDGPVLAFPAAEWAAFVAAVKDGALRG